MEKGLHVPILPGLGHHGLHIGLHAGEGGEVGLHIVLGLRHGDTDVLAQGVSGDAVDDAEVHGLGPAAHLVGHILRGHMEDLGGGGGMDVPSVPEGLLHGLVPGDAGQEPQLDLGVVRVYQ